MVRCEENAFRAGQELAQSLDTIAAINAEKEDIMSRTKTEDITNENMRLFNISETNLSQPLSKESEATDVNEKLQEAEYDRMNRNSSVSYTSFLESLHLPFISSSSSKSLPSGGEPGQTKNRTKISSEEGSWNEWQYMLPNIIRNDSNSTKDSLHREAVQFMRGIMDEATHLKNYDVPYDPSLIIIVAAEMDGYQPRDGITALPDIWPGSEIRYIKNAGHVSSYLFKQDVFRHAIYDALDKISEKYPSKLEL